ncbi:MAG TPA: hypothetical protein VLH56_19195 [Dissulfurispiraceae bacterium]|nr:hypothetical protein [Dissulfurispiraceae bacterium]
MTADNSSTLADRLPTPDEIRRIQREHCAKADIENAERDKLLPPVNPNCLDYFSSPLYQGLPPTVYVVGTGPNGKAAWSRIPDDAYVIAVNQAMLIEGIPDPALWVTFDRTLWHEPKPWWQAALDRSDDLGTIRLFGDVNAGRVYSDYSFKYAPHFHEDPRKTLLHGVLRGGCNVAGCACQAAYWGGAKTIILCGIDMFGQVYYDGSVNPKVREEEWKWTHMFSQLLALIKAREVTVLSISPTALKVEVI